MVYSEVGKIQFIDYKMTAVTHINVLQYNLKDRVRKLGLEKIFVFQQDQDPEYVLIMVKLP